MKSIKVSIGGLMRRNILHQLFFAGKSLNSFSEAEPGCLFAQIKNLILRESNDNC